MECGLIDAASSGRGPQVHQSSAREGGHWILSIIYSNCIHSKPFSHMIEGVNHLVTFKTPATNISHYPFVITTVQKQDGCPSIRHF